MLGGAGAALCCGATGVFPLMTGLNPDCCFGVEFLGESLGLLADWASLLGLGEGFEVSGGFCGFALESVRDFFLSF